MEKKTSKSSFGDVIRAYWKGAKGQKTLFYFIIASAIAGNIVELITPLWYKRFFDLIASAPRTTETASILTTIVFAVLALNIVRFLLYRSSFFGVVVLESKAMSQLRQMSFDYMIDHSYSFFTNNFSGALVQRVNRFVRSFEKLIDTLVFNFIPLFISIVGIVYIIARQNRTIALVLFIWVIVTVAVNYIFSTWKLKYDLASAAADSKTTAYLSDVISNQNTVLSFAASVFESLGYKKVVTEQQRAVFRTWSLAELMNGTQHALIVAIEFFLFYYSIEYWRAGIITIGTFVLIQAYILNLTMRLWGFSNIIKSIYEGIGDAKEMVDILRLPYEVADAPDAASLKIDKGAIEFKNVSFSFNESRKVLDGIDLSIKAGEKIALIGPSGAGKSTVVKLLLRMYNLAQGEITIDGQDIQKVTQNSLRENISLVPQDPILFHRSLLDNIKYGKKDATDEEVFRAAKLAHCDEFIDPLPDKYDTFVGERGIKLSGGERQRVAIARAILKNAPILVLDEATSSLDSHSEALIQDALDKLMEGKTTIVIAHRLSTIRKMDRIIVLEKGKIIEEGTHDDLTSRKESLYKNLWSLQAGGFLVDEENSQE